MSPLATKSATAWTTLPKLVAVPRGVSARTSCSRNHFSGQPRMLSSPLPDSEIGRSASRTGRSLTVASARPHHVAGSASGTRGSPSGSRWAASTASRSTAARRSVTEAAGSSDDMAQLGDEPVEGDLVPGTTRDREGLTAAQGRSDIVDETTRPVAARVLLVDRRDVQLAPGARAGDVEQPPLLLEQVGGPRAGADAGGRELLGAQGRAARAQVGPHALLRAHDPDLVPLQALGPVGREDADGIGSGAAVRHRLRRDLLVREGVDEGANPEEARIATRQPLGRVDQGHDGVEVVVRRTRAVDGRRPQAVRPAVRRAPAGPERPEHLLRSGPGLDLRPDLREQAGQPGDRHRHRIVCREPRRQACSPQKRTQRRARGSGRRTAATRSPPRGAAPAVPARAGGCHWRSVRPAAP